MAELNRKEFAAICHTTEAVVRTNIHRNKVIEFTDDNGKTKIDTEDPLNKAFFDKYMKLSKSKKQKKIEVDTDDVYDQVVKKVSRKIETDSKEEKKQESRKASQKKVDWDVRKKKADALLQERKAEKELLNLDKLAGKLIPLELTFNIIRIHNQDIFATFHNDLENQASIFCDILAGGDRKKLAKITQALAQSLERTINRAKEVAMSSVQAAVLEYAEVRNRGEKK